MKNIEINYYQGPSHGWIKVPKHLVERVGLKPTEYSFFNPKSDNYYLEEDCDASRFVSEMKKININIIFISIDLKSESTIRSYPRCKV